MTFTLQDEISVPWRGIEANHDYDIRKASNMNYQVLSNTEITNKCCVDLWEPTDVSIRTDRQVRGKKSFSVQHCFVPHTPTSCYTGQSVLQ